MKSFSIATVAASLTATLVFTTCFMPSVASRASPADEYEYAELSYWVVQDGMQMFWRFTWSTPAETGTFTTKEQLMRQGMHMKEDEWNALPQDPGLDVVALNLAGSEGWELVDRCTGGTVDVIGGVDWTPVWWTFKRRVRS